MYLAVGAVVSFAGSEERKARIRSRGNWLVFISCAKQAAPLMMMEGAIIYFRQGA